MSNRDKLTTNHEIPPVNEVSIRALGNNALDMTNITGIDADYTEGVANAELNTEMDRTVDIILKIQDDPNFLSLCEQKGVDPLEADHPRYWLLFAQFVQNKIKAMREKGIDNVQLDILELAAHTPMFIFDQQKLDHLRKTTHKHGYKALNHHQIREYERSVLGLSRFNGRIRSFATKWDPEATALSTNLQKMIPLSINGKHHREYARHKISECMRGAQHEIGFAQILDAAGVDYREASPEDDVKGIDIIIEEHGRAPLFIDIKASLSEIEAHGSNGLFAMRNDGKIITYSMIRDSEFTEGRFHISNDAADSKAAEVPRILQQMRKVS